MEVKNYTEGAVEKGFSWVRKILLSFVWCPFLCLQRVFHLEIHLVQPSFFLVFGHPGNVISQTEIVGVRINFAASSGSSPKRRAKAIFPVFGLLVSNRSKIGSSKGSPNRFVMT